MLWHLLVCCVLSLHAPHVHVHASSPLVWEFDSRFGLQSSPTYGRYSSNIYFVSKTGTLFAIKAESGVVAFSFETHCRVEECMRGGGGGSSPLVVYNVSFIPTLPPPPPPPPPPTPSPSSSPSSSSILARSNDTNTPTFSPTPPPTPPPFCQESVLIGGVYAVSACNGHAYWHATLGSIITGAGSSSSSSSGSSRTIDIDNASPVVDFSAAAVAVAAASDTAAITATATPPPRIVGGQEEGGGGGGGGVVWLSARNAPVLFGLSLRSGKGLFVVKSLEGGGTTTPLLVCSGGCGDSSSRSSSSSSSGSSSSNRSESRVTAVIVGTGSTSSRRGATDGFVYGITYTSSSSDFASIKWKTVPKTQAHNAAFLAKAAAFTPSSSSSSSSSSSTLESTHITISSWQLAFIPSTYPDGTTHVLLALNASTGAEVWSAPFHARISTPVLASQCACVCGCVYVGSNDGFVTVLSIGGEYTVHGAGGAAQKDACKGGDIVWQAKLDSAIGSSVVLANDRLFVGTMMGSFYCLDASNGKINFVFSTGAAIVTTPLLVPAPPSLLALLLLQKQQQNQSSSTKVGVEGTLVVFGAGNGMLYALDASYTSPSPSSVTSVSSPAPTKTIVSERKSTNAPSFAPTLQAQEPASTKRHLSNDSLLKTLVIVLLLLQLWVGYAYCSYRRQKAKAAAQKQKNKKNKKTNNRGTGTSVSLQLVELGGKAKGEVDEVEEDNEGQEEEEEEEEGEEERGERDALLRYASNNWWGGGGGGGSGRGEEEEEGKVEGDGERGRRSTIGVRDIMLQWDEDQF